MKNKTPFLTGFSTRLLGSSKASAQARNARARRRLNACSIAASARMFAPLLDERFMDGLSAASRRRSFDEVTTFWAWTGQIINNNASCSQAVAQVQAWCAASGRVVPSSNTAAYCTSRKRLSDSFVDSVHQRLVASAQARQRPRDLWRGLTINAIDGSTGRLADTPANQEVFPQSSNQKPGCGFPLIGFVAAINLSSGVWLGSADGRLSTHDSALAGDLLHHFGIGDIVLADRAFNSWELVARLHQRGAHSLMRLHQGRHRKLDWRKGRRLGPNERLVKWRRPPQLPKGSKLDAAAWAALPEEIGMRYIRFGYQTRLGKKQPMILATTLLNPVSHPAAEVAKLYLSRWEIEVKLRDIKTTMGMEDFGVRSPGMARKTLRMMLVACNLVRSMMQRGVQRQGLALWEVSFKNCIDLLLSWQARYRGTKPGGKLATRLDRELLELLATKKLRQRPGRREPRALKLRPKSYAKLTSPRGEFKEVEQRTKKRNACA